MNVNKMNPIEKAYLMLVDFRDSNELDPYLDVDELIGYLGEALDDHTDENMEEIFEIMAAISNTTKEAGEAMDEMTSVIKDSGDRTQFASGAVRDMREGKGRFDVAPLEVIAAYICDDNDDGVDPVIWALNEFLKTGSTSYLYSTICNFEHMAWPDKYSMFLDVAVHYEQGAKKYGPSNWRKSIPTWCYIDSAIRHYIKWCRGDADERHDRAVIWNLLCCIWEVDYNPNRIEDVLNV